jgi:hypothetical protein
MPAPARTRIQVHDLGARDVRAAVARGAETPDFFSTQTTSELQAIFRDTKTQPLEQLVNTGAVRIDFAKGRIFRDSFWKGSFAKDSLAGFEVRSTTARWLLAWCTANRGESSRQLRTAKRPLG